MKYQLPDFILVKKKLCFFLKSGLEPLKTTTEDILPQCVSMTHILLWEKRPLKLMYGYNYVHLLQSFDHYVSSELMTCLEKILHLIFPHPF